MKKRIRFNRADLQDTGRAAKEMARRTGKTMYVYATAYGYAVIDYKMGFQKGLATDGSKVWEV